MQLFKSCNINYAEIKSRLATKYVNISGGKMETMVPLDDGRKFQVLLAELQERYAAAHKMRERGLQFVLWLSGIAIGLAWILISQRELTIIQKGGLSALVTVLFIGALHIISGLRRGFQKNRETMIRIEEALGLHQENCYLKDSPLLPTDYRSTKRRWTDHFSTLLIWLALIAISLLVLTWAGPCQTADVSKVPEIQHSTKGTKNG
jgi:hypothetical protein